jgi:NAD-dependent deacetylase
MQEQLDRVRAGEADPPCTSCGGIQKSATIAFGEQLDAEVIAAGNAAAEACDLFLAIGTSLTVQPAAMLPWAALQSGARLVIVNAQATPYDDKAEAILRGSIGDVLPAAVSASLS